MKALMLQEYGKFEYLDVPEPEYGPEEVLIQVKACGICGSDVHGMDGSTGRRKPPIIMGHEASGVILAVGPKVSSWKIGDRVTFDSTVYCGKCFFCARGQFNLCDNRMVLGVSCDEYRRHGAFAELVAVPQHILFKLPEETTFTQAAMCEALSIGVHAVSLPPFEASSTALVVGTGMIGLLLIQAARAAGYQRIIAVDVDPGRLKVAVEFGASVAVPADGRDVAAEVVKLTEGRGADTAFEVVGMEKTINVAIDSLRKGGCLTLVGNLSPTVEVPLQKIVTRQLSLYGSCASNGEYPTCLDMIAHKRANVDRLISAVAPLSEGASWFDRLYRKEPGLMKVILVP